MKRLLTNAVIFAGGLMVSSQLLALGLGELKLESALSQPLKAEIELVDAKNLTKWEIKPNLATQKDFDLAGVERVFFLTKIEFKVEGDRIVLSTREPINEPFLNFLIELNWPSGRVLREYTVLLDPPTYDEQNFQPLVVSPEMQVVEEELVVATPEQPVLVNRWSEPATTGTYKVQPSDTLWAIALENRPSSDITPQQMMLAIQQENPQAFINGNINRLKSHHVLRIPDEQQIRSIGVASAVAEVSRQNRALSTATAQYDATGRAGDTATQQPSQSGGEVRLIAAKTADAKAAGAAGEVGEGAGVSRQALENDLAIALENADKSQRDNEELSERLVSLEEQINTLQRLISLKDDQLAGLQAGNAVVAVPTEVEQPAEVAVETEATNEQDFNFAEAQDESAVEDQQEAAYSAALAAEQAAAEEKDRLEKQAALQAEKAQLEEKSIVDKLIENPLIPAAGAAVLLLIILLSLRALKKSKAKAVVTEDHATDEVMLRDIELNEGSLDDFDFSENDDNQSFEQEDGDESGATEQASSEDAAVVAQTEDVLTESDIYIAFGNFDQAAQLLKGAILSEPQRSELYLKLLEVFVETDDAAQFAEVEAQLANIDDASASAEAEQLRQRLSAPIAPSFDQADGLDNADFNEADFAESELPATAFDIEEGLDVDFSGEFDEGLDFADALEMDAKPASDNSETDAVPTLDLEEDIQLDKATQDSNDIDFNFGDDAELEIPELEVEESELTEQNENSLDFDMGSKDQDQVETLEFNASEEELEGIDSFEDILDSKETSLEESTELSFDTEDLNVDEVNVEEESELDLPDFSDDELDFDLGGSTPAAPVVDEAEETIELEEVELEEVELEEAEIELEVAEQVKPAAESSKKIASSDEIDLDELAASDNEFDFLAGTDECATKLDLARAYIDMEDIFGARELLQEVADEGSDLQKSEARELLANLA